MRAPDRPLEHGPERLKRVDVGIAIRPDLPAVVDGRMVVTERLENAIRVPFVGTDARSDGDMPDDTGSGSGLASALAGFGEPPTILTLARESRRSTGGRRVCLYLCKSIGTRV